MDLWHKQYFWLSECLVSKLLDFVKGLRNVGLREKAVCANFEKAKSTCKARPPCMRSSRKCRLESAHSGVDGPIDTALYHGLKHFLTLLDEKKAYFTVKFVRCKCIVA